METLGELEFELGVLGFVLDEETQNWNRPDGTYFVSHDALGAGNALFGTTMLRMSYEIAVADKKDWS